MGKIIRSVTRGGPVSGVPLVADRVSADHEEVSDAGALPDAVHGAAYHPPPVLLHGLPLHLAQGCDGGTTRTGCSGMAAELEVLASEPVSETTQVIRCSRADLTHHKQRITWVVSETVPDARTSS